MTSDLNRQRIAAAVSMLRPDWPAGSILTVMTHPSLDHRPLPDLAVALVRAALDPDTRTPARITQPGPWWDQPASIGVSADEHPSARPLASVLTFPRQPLPDPAPYVQRIRASLASRRAHTP